MIVSRIDGGLGNQMFQYAFGLYLAQKHETDFMLDISSYESQPAHEFMLDRFQILATLADSAARNRYPRRYRQRTNSDWWRSVFGPRALRHVRQRPFGFQPKYLSVSDNSFLEGYWQSELFFPEMRATLLEHFQPAAALSSATRQCQEEMLNSNSIAVHIRRGDYLSNPTNAQIYRQLAIEYYRACVDDWASHRLNAKVFVFSNDLNWCRENLQLNLPTKYIAHTQTEMAHEDLLMMTKAACCVTANSTFSWWGAWLNDRADRVVYAPRRWFRAGKLDDRDIACIDWITVDLDEMSVKLESSDATSSFSKSGVTTNLKAA